MVMAALPAAAPKRLAIVKTAVRQYEGGPLLAPSASFLTGETVFVSFQIDGYQLSPESEVNLGVRIEAVDPDGTALVKPVERTIAEHVSPEDKNWMPVVHESIELPVLAFSGVYHIKALVEDKNSKETAKAEIDVSVRGKQVERSDALASQNFRFLRGEDDRDPLVEPVYKPGDSVWARFEITGFRHGANNRIQVSYGLMVLGKSGTTLFSQPQAAVEQDESFYPKRYVPGVLSLNLDKNVKPGEYTLVVIIQDEIGNQTAESRHVFRVE
jgi:hypothetical protein